MMDRIRRTRRPARGSPAAFSYTVFVATWARFWQELAVRVGAWGAAAGFALTAAAFLLLMALS